MIPFYGEQEFLKTRNEKDIVLMKFDECVKLADDPRVCMKHDYLLWFCGYSNKCYESQKDNSSRYALDEAINNIKKYSLVGYVEGKTKSTPGIPRFYRALDLKFPDWFGKKGILCSLGLCRSGVLMRRYEQDSDSKVHKMKTTCKFDLTKETEDILRPYLWREYELYNFIQQKFDKELNDMESQVNRNFWGRIIAVLAVFTMIFVLVLLKCRTRNDNEEVTNNGTNNEQVIELQALNTS